MMSRLLVVDAGILPYNEGLRLQNRVLEARMNGVIPDTLLLLEHSPVITLGRRAKKENLLLSEEKYRELGIELVSVNRGGDVTFHGPGQLVGYVIAHVPGFSGTVSDLVKGIGESIKKTVNEFGVEAEFREDMPGVWVSNPLRKLAAIGLHIQRGYSMHGFALNVLNDLRYFDLIIPCGIKSYGVSSLRELGVEASMSLVKARIAGTVAKHFHKEMQVLSLEELEKQLR